jgi:hypothetical protein
VEVAGRREESMLREGLELIARVGKKRVGGLRGAGSTSEGVLPAQR